MKLLDLPLEVFKNIIKILVDSSNIREGLQFREISSIFAQEIEQEYTRRRVGFTSTRPIAQHDIAHPQILSSKAEIFSYILQGLITPTPSENTLFPSEVEWSLRLRLAAAVLMGTSELQFPDIPLDAAVESRGLLEDHSDRPSRHRLIKIYELISATVTYYTGIQKLPHQFGLYGWFVRSGTRPIVWAIATAVYMENFPVAKKLLSLFTASVAPEHSDLIRADWKFDIARHAIILDLAVKKCSYSMVSLVLEHKSDLNYPPFTDSRAYPLEVASKRGSLEIVQLLVNPCWSQSPYGLLGWFAPAAQCHCSIGGPQECEERIQVIKLLLNWNFNNDVQEVRNSLLAEACRWGCKKITCFMLRIGAEPNCTTRKYRSALIYAACHGHTELMEYLLERGVRHSAVFLPTNSVTFVIEAANPAMITDLSDQDVVILKQSSLDEAKARFIFRTAAEKNCFRVVNLLLQAGFNLWAGNQGTAALEAAVANNSANVIEILTSKGL